LRIQISGAALAASVLAQAPEGYSTFAEVERKITALARQHPATVRLTAIGTSAGGRKIHALEIAAKGTVPPAQRPAIFVGANIAGFHNAGAEAALRLAERRTAQTASVRETRTFYILPSMNPDAHDAMFAKVRWRNSLNGGCSSMALRDSPRGRSFSWWRAGAKSPSSTTA
jgi:murein tripeptide amidase MpaA